VLVENKFIYISLPRCASTSFAISCAKNKLNVKTLINEHEIGYNNIDITIDNEMIADSFPHMHEPIDQLESKFENNYEIISVKRNRYERFLSLWYHIIDEEKRTGLIENCNKLIRMDENDIFSHITSSDVLRDTHKKYVAEFIMKHKLIDTSHLTSMLSILFLPCSTWHQHHKKIIWFDIDKLYELEEWVSNKLNINFKLEKINSSNHFTGNLKMNDNFIEKYNTIYDRFDLTKTIKTFL
jgi:hypothetical protein